VALGVLEANEVQAQAEASVRRISSQRSVDMESPMFNVPEKMVLGNYGGAVLLPRLIELIEERMSPEDFAVRLRSLGVPIGLGFGSLLWCFPLGRLQRHLDAGWPEHDVEDDLNEEALRVYSFYARAAPVFRNDGKLLPGVGGAPQTLPILDDAIVTDLAQRCRERGAPEDLTGVRRVLGQLGTYIFLSHAEQRDGIFAHGPYPLEDGSVLLVKEYTDLQNHYLPWMTQDRWLPSPRIVIPMIVRDVEATFDQFGTLYSDQDDLLGRAEGFEILAGTDLLSLDETEFKAIGQATIPIQKSLFREMMGYDEDQKTLVGPPTYGNAFSGLLEVAGYDHNAIRDQLIEPWIEIGSRYIGRASRVWEYVGSGREPLFPKVK
jgi:hypothetical protein